MRQQPAPGRRAPQHQPEPGDQWHVVLGDRLAGDQAQPVQRPAVQRFNDGAARPGRQRRGRQPEQRHQQRAGHQQRSAGHAPHQQPAGGDQHHRQPVQHTKVDEAARKHEPGAQRHQQRAARHLRPAAPEARPALPLRHGHRLPHAGGEQEQADDGAALPGPDRVFVEVLVDVAGVVEIEREVEGRHPQHGQAAQRVQALQTLRGTSGGDMGAVLGGHGHDVIVARRHGPGARGQVSSQNGFQPRNSGRRQLFLR